MNDDVICRTYTAITSRLSGKPSEYRVYNAILIKSVFTFGGYLLKPKPLFETFGENRVPLFKVDAHVESIYMFFLSTDLLCSIGVHTLYSLVSLLVIQ